MSVRDDSVSQLTPYSGYSPLDFSVLDPHWGTIQDWRDMIDAVHARGMYFMADFTVGTMGDLIGFEGCVIILLTGFSNYSLWLQPSQCEYPVQSRRVQGSLEAPQLRSLELYRVPRLSR